jgi:uncharacterized protein with GYD domain
MMPKYVTLWKYRGPIEGGGPERFEQLQQFAADENGKILQVYGLLGAYDAISINDAISISEFPDNRSAMKAAAKSGNLIGARSHTMAAVELDDFLQLLAEL